MISEVIRFDGGLSTKTSPHLIASNEGVICQNVDLEKGTLYPLPSLQYINTVNGKHIYTKAGLIVSNQDTEDDRYYVEYGDRLYWSNHKFGSYGIMRYDGTNVGVDAEAPDPLSQTEIDYITINEDSGVQGFLTTGANYTYAFTIVDNEGIESTPMFKGGVDVSANKNSMKLELSVTNWNNITANHPDAVGINIYRTGGDNPTFNLVYSEISRYSEDVVDDGTNLTWYDKLADIDVSRIELTTFDNNAPINNLTMLTENRGTFFGSYKDKVYFSQTGSIEFWNTLDFVKLDRECTGIGKFGDSILAFTKTDSYLISGHNRDTITMQRLPYNQGCVNPHTVVNIDNYLVWVSMNGICIFNGSEVQVVTKKTLSWDEFGRLGNLTYQDFDGTTSSWNTDKGYDIRYATGYQDKYYGVFQDGILILDISNGLKVSTIAVSSVVSVSLNKDDNALYVAVDNGTNYDVYIYSNSSSKMIATWKTGRLEGESVNVKKHYRQVELDGEPISVEVFIDGVSKFTSNKSKFFLPAGSIGKDIQFEITTVNEIRALKMQYSLLKA